MTQTHDSPPSDPDAPAVDEGAQTAPGAPAGKGGAQAPAHGWRDGAPVAVVLALILAAAVARSPSSASSSPSWPSS